MFSFGSDPEFFLTQRGKFKSAISFFPSKETPIKKDGCLFYYDNVLAEAQVEPAESREEAVTNMGTCLHNIEELADPCKVVLQSAVNFHESELKDNDARIAGCMPEWCAYTLTQVLPPSEIIQNTPFRTAGGHVHLGNNDLFQNGMQILNVIRMLDLFLAVPSVLLDKDKTAKARREVYGHAGTHRVPDHGIEYRALSNYWLASPELVRLVYDICSFTIAFVEKGGHEKYWSIDEDLLDSDDPSLAHRCFGYDSNSLQKCINNCDKKMAEKFMMIISNHMPSHICDRIELFQTKEFNMYKEWDLGF